MESGDRAVHDSPRDELEIGDRGERHRVRANSLISGSRREAAWTISSASMPSASAWKFTSTRWRRTGSATARMSSKSTTVRPSSSARALPPSSSAWPARGPAPQRTHLRTKSGASSPAGTRRPHQAGREVDHVLGGGDVADEPVQPLDFVSNT